MTLSNTSDRRNVLKKIGAVSAVGGITNLAGCVSDSDEVTLEFNSPAGEESIQGLVPTWFSEYIDEIDEGIEIEVFYGGELGGHGESIDNVTTGALDMYVGGYSLYGGFDPLIQAFTPPFLYDDPIEAIETLDRDENEIFDEVLTGLQEEHNLRFLEPSPQGLRRLTANEPIREPSDIEGLDFRAPPTPLHTNIIRGMGANPQEIDQPEIPQALATGTVDGQENPYNIIYGDGIYEQQDYIIETDHTVTLLPPVINEEVYQGLTPEQQDAIHEAAEMTSERAIEWWENETESTKELLRDSGLEIIEADEIDRSAWADQVNSHIRSEMSDEWIQTVEEISPDW